MLVLFMTVLPLDELLDELLDDEDAGGDALAGVCPLGALAPPDAFGGITTTVPFIVGWMVQRYPNVPTFVKVKL